MYHARSIHRYSTSLRLLSHTSLDLDDDDYYYYYYHGSRPPTGITTRLSPLACFAAQRRRVKPRTCTHIQAMHWAWRGA